MEELIIFVECDAQWSGGIFDLLSYWLIPINQKKMNFNNSALIWHLEKWEWSERCNDILWSIINLKSHATIVKSPERKAFTQVTDSFTKSSTALLFQNRLKQDRNRNRYMSRTDWVLSDHEVSSINQTHKVCHLHIFHN